MIGDIIRLSAYIRCTEALDRVTSHMQPTPALTSSPLLSRQQFLAGLRTAIDQQVGYATAKVGASEVVRMNYSLVAAHPQGNSKLLKVLEPTLFYHSLKQAALFPPDPQFYLKYNRLYADQMGWLDCLGVFPERLQRTQAILDFYRLALPLVNYLDQEPDRSTPANESNCYLPFFRGKKLLIVCSFAELLRQRATPDIFEAVWAKTGKPWFYPAQVDALEFPYGYTAATHQRYPDSLHLLEDITAAISRRDFDIALVAAAGMGIPLVSSIKRLGKVGIHLGGHLQVLFGVMGQRWRQRQDWREQYVTPAWIDMPASYRPPETDIADRGAYW